jgi:hypothetical protein
MARIDPKVEGDERAAVGPTGSRYCTCPTCVLVIVAERVHH